MLSLYFITYLKKLTEKYSKNSTKDLCLRCQQLMACVQPMNAHTQHILDTSNNGIGSSSSCSSNNNNNNRPRRCI